MAKEEKYTKADIDRFKRIYKYYEMKRIDLPGGRFVVNLSSEGKSIGDFKDFAQAGLHLRDLKHIIDEYEGKKTEVKLMAPAKGKGKGKKAKEEAKEEKPVEPAKSKDSYEYKGYTVNAAKDKSGSIVGYFLTKDGTRVKSADNKKLQFEEASAAEGYVDGLLVYEPHKEAVAEQKAEEAKAEKTEPKLKVVKYKKFFITPIMDARGKLERYDIYKEDESYFGNSKYLDGAKESIDKKLAKAKKQEAAVTEEKPAKKKTGAKPEKKAGEKKPTAETKTTEMSPESTMYRIYKRWTTEQVAGAAKKAKVTVGDDKRAMIAAIIKKVGDDYKKIAELFK